MQVVGEDGETATPKKRYTAVLIHILLMTTNLKILNSLPCVHCRKRQVAEDIAGPSQKNKKISPKRKKTPMKKKTPKKKKTPAKKKQKQAQAAPAPSVVRSLKAWLNTSAGGSEA